MSYTPSVLISSRQNPKIKTLAKLKQKKYRDRLGSFLVEGYYPILFALNNDYPLEEVFVCRKLLRSKFDNGALLRRLQLRGVKVTEVLEGVFFKLSSLESPEGIIAVAPELRRSLKDVTFSKDKPSLFVILESIEKLGNLGALLRLADNAGATGVIVCDMRADIFNPETIRSSVGTFFSVPVYHATSQEALTWCKRNNISVLATTPSATKPYYSVDLKQPVGIALGTEYAGLSSIWLEGATEKILIPMYGQANSLSVTASGAIVLYEAVRQRYFS